MARANDNPSGLVGGSFWQTAGNVITGHFRGHRSPPMRPEEVQALRDTGWTKKNHAWISPTGHKVEKRINARMYAWQAQAQLARAAKLNTASAVDTMPLPSVPGFGISVEAAAILRTIVGGVIAGGLLWPRTAGEGSDLYRRLPDGTLAVPGAALPRPGAGGRTRGGRRGRSKSKRRSRRRPRAVTLPPPPVVGGVARPGRVARTAPRTADRPGAAVLERVMTGNRPPPPVAVPSEQPATSSRSSSSSRSSPATMPGTSSPAIPAPSVPAPVPATVPPATAAPSLPSWLVKGAELVLPAAFAYLTRAPATSPSVRTSSQPQQQLAAQALTSLQTAAVPFAATQAQSDRCSCAKPRKRKKDACRNPVTRRTKRERDGATYITTTRRIECQA